MIILPGVELTMGGRPRLSPGEIEQGSLEKVALPSPLFGSADCINAIVLRQERS